MTGQITQFDRQRRRWKNFMCLLLCMNIVLSTTHCRVFRQSYAPLTFIHPCRLNSRDKFHLSFGHVLLSLFVVPRRVRPCGRHISVLSVKSCFICLVFFCTWTVTVSVCLSSFISAARAAFKFCPDLSCQETRNGWRYGEGGKLWFN